MSKKFFLIVKVIYDFKKNVSLQSANPSLPSHPLTKVRVPPLPGSSTCQPEETVKMQVGPDHILLRTLLTASHHSIQRPGHESGLEGLTESALHPTPGLFTLYPTASALFPLLPEPRGPQLLPVCRKRGSLCPSTLSNGILPIILFLLSCALFSLARAVPLHTVHVSYVTIFRSEGSERSMKAQAAVCSVHCKSRF